MARSPLKRFNQGFPGLDRFSQDFGNRFEQGFPGADRRFNETQLPPVFGAGDRQQFAPNLQEIQNFQQPALPQPIQRPAQDFPQQPAFQPPQAGIGLFEQQQFNQPFQPPVISDPGQPQLPGVKDQFGGGGVLPQPAGLPVKPGAGVTPPIVGPGGLPAPTPTQIFPADVKNQFGGGGVLPQPPGTTPGINPFPGGLPAGGQPNLQQLLGTAFGGGDPFAGLVQQTQQFEAPPEISPDQLLASLNLPQPVVGPQPNPVQPNIAQILQQLGSVGGAGGFGGGGNFGGLDSKFGINRRRF